MDYAFGAFVVSIVTLAWVVAYSSFVAWRVFTINRDLNDGLDYVQGVGEYEKSGGLSGDVMDAVNRRFAGGVVGAVGEILAPLLEEAGTSIKQGLAQRRQAELSKKVDLNGNAAGATALLVEQAQEQGTTTTKE